MKSLKPSVIIVEDNEMFRDGIVSILHLDEIANVLAVASNGKEYMELLEKYKPDLVLMDIEMPIMNGIEAARVSIRKYPKLKILALSMYGEERYCSDMLEAGAKGFVLKTANKIELIRAVKDVINDKVYFSNELLQNIIVGFKNSNNNNEKEQIVFTDRELEIMKLICQGLSSKEISDKLFLSKKTIENYRAKLLNKTKCKNSVSLAVYAIKNHLVD